MDEDNKDLYLFDDEDEVMEESRSRKVGRLVFKLIAVLLLFAFLAFSYQDLAEICSSKLNFLAQNQSLSGDEMVKKCRPAVVSIQSLDTDGLAGSFVRGTGFNLEPYGLLITNRHVVDGAKQVQITFSDGNVYFSNDITMVDNFDIAIIKLHEKGLPTLKAAVDQTVQTGEVVTVIGNPLGFERVAVRGKVGEFHNGGSAGSVIFDIGVIINSGSSGSPVINQKGEVIGIVFAQTIGEKDNQQSSALAIPINAIKSYI